MFTIIDLIDQVEIQGPVQIKRIRGDDIDVVYESKDGLFETIETKPFLNKEILFMYTNSIPALCIEYREEDE